MSDTKPETYHFVDPPARNRELRGIEGWLVFMAIGIVFSAVASFIGFFWNVCRLETAPTPIPLAVQADAAVEIAVNAILTIGWTAAAILMFRHKRAFVWLWFAPVIALSGRNLAGLYLAPETLSAKDRSAIVRSLLMPAVWVPYMLVSKQVKNTFVN